MEAFEAWRGSERRAGATPAYRRGAAGKRSANGAIGAPGTEERAARSKEDRRLLERYHRDGDPAAREALVERFLPLARQLARRYQRAGEPLDDLVQVASLGLLKAIDRFDPARETAFSSFAVPTSSASSSATSVTRAGRCACPRDLQELAVKVDRAGEEMTRELGRAPTPNEIGERLGATAEQVLEAREAAHAYRAVSLDRPRGRTRTRRATSSPTRSAIEDPGFARAEDAATIERLMRVL